MFQCGDLSQRCGVPQDHILRPSRNQVTIRRPGRGSPVVLMSRGTAKNQALPPIRENDFPPRVYTRQSAAVGREDGVVSIPGWIELTGQRLSGRQIPGVVGVVATAVVKDQPPAVLRKEQVIWFTGATRYSSNLLPASHPPQNRIISRRVGALGGRDQQSPVRRERDGADAFTMPAQRGRLLQPHGVPHDYRPVVARGRKPLPVGRERDRNDPIRVVVEFL